MIHRDMVFRLLHHSAHRSRYQTQLLTFSLLFEFLRELLLRMVKILRVLISPFVRYHVKAGIPKTLLDSHEIP